MSEALKREFDYYLENQDELVKLHNGKILVIKDCTVIGVYSSDKEAIIETAKKHELGTFLVQKCSPGTDDYTQIFHSRLSLV